MTKQIDSAKRKELIRFLNDTYNQIKLKFANELNTKSRIGLSGIFSVASKIAKKGTADDFEFIIKQAENAKIIIISGIIPDDLMVLMNKEREKLPSEISQSITDNVIQSMLAKLHKPEFISIIESIISKFKSAIE